VGSDRFALPTAREAVRLVLQPEEWPQPTPFPWVQLIPRTTMMSAAMGMRSSTALPIMVAAVSGPSALG
jgi:hypothetical protein